MKDTIYNIDELVEIALIVKDYMKVKGDMLVMENISRYKNKKDFEKIEQFLMFDTVE